MDESASRARGSAGVWSMRVSRHHDLPDGLPRGERVEGAVEFVEFDRFASEPFDGQPPGPPERDQQGDVALRDGGAEVGPFRVRLSATIESAFNVRSREGWGSPIATVVPPRAVAS